jgi:hypothetical protein
MDQTLAVPERDHEKRGDTLAQDPRETAFLQYENASDPST